MDCLFCKMAAGQIKPDVVYEDEQVLVFRDIAPQAPVHVLLIPKKHVANIDALTAGDAALAGHILLTAGRVARQLGIADSGFRLASNCNAQGGQTVYHLHFHLLGGRQMTWPPG
ncbi:MAG: histidine triad nucleotide-binding protein [Gammaproteobacteria bacterium]